MKEPTIEEIKEEKWQYQKHLDLGGKPIRLIVELEPVEDGLRWTIQGEVPPELKTLKLPWIAIFVTYIRDQVVKSLTIPAWLTEIKEGDKQ
jgi:hypothetical protein